MTITAQANRKEYTGNGVTTSFSYPYAFVAQGDLVVTVAGTTKTLTTDYTISGTADTAGRYLSGANVVFGTAPASAAAVVIYNDPDIEQELDLVENDALPAEELEKAFDLLTLLVRRLSDRIDRSFVLADIDVSGASTVLPTPAASKLVGWNASATALTNYALASITDSIIPTAFAETILDDADGEEVFQTLVTSAAAETSPAAGDLILISDVSLTPDDGRKMTLGNMLKVVIDLTEDLAPAKTADYLLTYDASASGAKKVKLEEFPLPRGFLGGGVLSNNAGDATNDIDVAAGEARDSTNAVNIRWSALTKQLDAAWAVGSAAGGLDTGAIANTTYHVYAIRKDSDGTGDVLFSTSASAPTMPAGYTYFRRIGSILRESAAIVAFNQYGDEFIRAAPTLDVDTTNPGTSAVTATLKAPVGITVQAILEVLAIGGSNNLALYLSALTATDSAASTSAVPLATLVTPGTGTAQIAAVQARAWTNTSAQVRYRISASGASDVVRIATVGWLDRRGKDT